MTTNLPNGKPHVSYSELSVWMKCSWKHRLKYVNKIDLDPRGIETILGTAFHACVELRVRDVVPVRDDIVKIVKDNLEMVTDSKLRENFDVEACVDRAFIMSEEAIVFLNEKFPNWKLLEAEENLYEKLTLEGLNHEDVSFKGYVDLVIQVPNNRGKLVTWIIDWKTAARPWDKKKLMDASVTYQLSLYKNFWATKHKVPLEEVRCGYIIGLKAGKPGKIFNFIPISVGPTTSKRTLTVLNNFVGSVKRNMALKNKSEQNCRWCEYRNTEWCP
jgi:hypothetical protein